jgi:hypothetical protein
MNFDFMPELHEPWGYPAALSRMAASSLILFILFKTPRLVCDRHSAGCTVAARRQAVHRARWAHGAGDHEGVRLSDRRRVLAHYPRRYARRGELTSLAELTIDESVTIVGEVRTCHERSMRANAARSSRCRSPTGAGS